MSLPQGYEVHHSKQISPLSFALVLSTHMRHKLMLSHGDILNKNISMAKIYNREAFETPQSLGLWIRFCESFSVFHRYCLLLSVYRRKIPCNSESRRSFVTSYKWSHTDLLNVGSSSPCSLSNFDFFRGIVDTSNLLDVEPHAPARSSKLFHTL